MSTRRGRPRKNYPNRSQAERPKKADTAQKVEKPRPPERPKKRSTSSVITEGDISKLRASLKNVDPDDARKAHAARVKASKIPSSVNDRLKQAISNIEFDIVDTKAALSKATSSERSHLSSKLASLQAKRALLDKTDLSRYMRNQQSSINRDIKNTEKALGRTKDSTERRNLEHRLKELQNLKETMAASFQGEEGRVYNPANARIDALNEYLTKFKGAAHLEEQRAYQVRSDLEYSAEFQRRFEKRWREAVNEAVDGSAYANTVQYQELYEDYVQALRSFDSDEAKRVVSKMEAGRKRYYTNRPRINQGRKAK